MTARDLAARLENVRPQRSLLPWIIATAAIVILAVIAGVILLRRTLPVAQPASIPPPQTIPSTQPAAPSVSPPPVLQQPAQKAAKTPTPKPKARKPQPESTPEPAVEIRGAQPKVKVGNDKQEEE